MRDAAGTRRATVPAAFLLCAVAGAHLNASGWIGRTEEVFTPIEKAGLGRPRMATVQFPDVIPLDVDRDGADDVVTVLTAGTRSVLRCLRRAPDGTLAATWRAELTHAHGARVASVTSARIDGDRHPELIVSTTHPPYLYCFMGRGAALFATEPLPLASRFPPRMARPGVRVESYLNLRGIVDWDGDGHDDLIVHVRCAAAGADGHEIRHMDRLHVLRGGAHWGADAQQVLDLMELGANARLLHVDDVDGDGVVELLLAVDRLRGGGIRAGRLLFLQHTGAALRERAYWPYEDRGAMACAARDLNGDGLRDVMLVDTAHAHLALLLTRRQTGRGFRFELTEAAMPRGAYPSPPQETLVAVHDLDGNGAVDIVTVSRAHNQVHVFARGENGAITPHMFHLPSLPQAPALPGDAWHDKAFWFGDLDQDGVPELLVLTNEPLDPDFVPSAAMDAAGPDGLIRPILQDEWKRRFYAPYFRLLVYRLDTAQARLVTVINSHIPAAGYAPAAVSVQDLDFDGRQRLVLSARERRSGALVHAMVDITGRLPLAAPET